MYFNDKILFGKAGNEDIYLLPKMANRHGLITGATGTGKTITLKVLAESFSNAGVPVFMVDVKGDLAGTAYMGVPNENVDTRVQKLGLEGFTYDRFPCVFLDTYGKNGHPVRTTVLNMGHRLISKMLDLSEVQDSVLAIVFKIAKDENIALDDLEDLQRLIGYVSTNYKNYTAQYGNLAPQSLNTIQRNVIELMDKIEDNFFGLPKFDYNHLINTSMETGKGRISILDAQVLFNYPDSYVSMILWLLNSLYDNLPEVGDLDKPKLVFFFDEAHLIFNNMPKSVVDHVIQIVKLIRSKGVGLYFISQNPSDIPNEVLSQLGNKIQHALRAYTPNEQKAVQAAADGLRANPEFDTKEAILNLGTGEALVSVIDEKGEPTIVKKTTILPPQSRMGTITLEERTLIINNSPIANIYENKIEQVSAKEIIDEKNKKAQEEAQRIADEKEEEKRKKEEEKLAKEAEREEAKKKREEEKAKKEAEREKKNSVGYKLGNKVKNKAENKLIDRALNKLFKFFK